MKVQSLSRALSVWITRWIQINWPQWVGMLNVWLYLVLFVGTPNHQPAVHRKQAHGRVIEEVAWPPMRTACAVVLDPGSGLVQVPPLAFPAGRRA
jgi:hypothetical protein